MVEWYTLHQGLDYPSRHSGDGIRWLEKRWLGALSTKGWTPDAHQWGDHLLLVTIFYWALSFTGRWLENRDGGMVNCPPRAGHVTEWALGKFPPRPSCTNESGLKAHCEVATRRVLIQAKIRVSYQNFVKTQS